MCTFVARARANKILLPSCECHMCKYTVTSRFKIYGNSNIPSLCADTLNRFVTVRVSKLFHAIGKSSLFLTDFFSHFLSEKQKKFDTRQRIQKSNSIHSNPDDHPVFERNLDFPNTHTLRNHLNCPL